MRNYTIHKNLLKKIIVLLVVYSLSNLLPQILNWQSSSILAADTIPPNITINEPVNGSSFNSNSITVSGNTEAGIPVEVYIDDVLIVNVNSDAAGNWSSSLPNLAEGNHSLYALAKDAAGNIGISASINFTIDLTPPAISILSPQNNGYVSSSTILGQTEPYLSVSVFIDTQLYSVSADETGQWSVTDNQLLEGSHVVYASTQDKAGNQGSSESITYIFDKTRPIVGTDFQPPDNMTRVTLDSSIGFTFLDSSPIDISKISDAIIVMENSLPVVGLISYDSVTKKLVFTPSNPLKPLTRYYVYVNPLLTDMAGNLIYSRSWSFTTAGASITDQPHGNYTDNVNTCKNCHGTHTSTGPKLDKPDFPNLPQMDNYCNACHDGTVASIPNNWLLTYKHNYRVKNSISAGADACANCHNPHLSWTSENSNLLQDAYFFDHGDPTNPFLPKSSEEQLCENCHEPNIKNNVSVTYKVFMYKKRDTTTGNKDDYELCLRCHDGKSAVDISTYYSTPSGHSITALDGSPINGAISCADCHESHGSNNIKLLKEELGHTKTTTYQNVATEWDVASERQFCLSCHNNTTELYGKPIAYNETVPGHEITSIEFCNKCHGAGSAVKAAHGPVKP